MTTSEAAEGRTVWYVKFCPYGREECRDYAWDKDKWGYTKDEAITKFTDHLFCAHSIVSDRLMQSICDDLEFGSYFDHGAEDPPTPPMPPSALTPKQPAAPPPSGKNEPADDPAENASGSSDRRKVQLLDAAPSPEPDDDTIEICPDVVAALNMADEQIKTANRNTKAWNKATRLFASTMNDAITILENSAATMSNL